RFGMRLIFGRHYFTGQNKSRSNLKNYIQIMIKIRFILVILFIYLIPCLVALQAVELRLTVLVVEDRLVLVEVGVLLGVEGGGERDKQSFDTGFTLLLYLIFIFIVKSPLKK